MLNSSTLDTESSYGEPQFVSVTYAPHPQDDEGNYLIFLYKKNIRGKDYIAETRTINQIAHNSLCPVCNHRGTGDWR